MHETDYLAACPCWLLGCGPPEIYADVRFGSLADLDVRFSLNDVRFPPKADIRLKFYQAK